MATAETAALSCRGGGSTRDGRLASVTQDLRVLSPSLSYAYPQNLTLWSIRFLYRSFHRDSNGVTHRSSRAWPQAQSLGWKLPTPTASSFVVENEHPGEPGATSCCLRAASHGEGSSLLSILILQEPSQPGLVQPHPPPLGALSVHKLLAPCWLAPSTGKIYNPTPEG